MSGSRPPRAEQPARGRARVPRPAAMLRPASDSTLGRELFAGLTLAALCLPLNIGYAEAAGLPAAVGINASILPLIVFAILSGSRQLVTGPDATIAALLAAVLPGVAASSGAAPADLALAVALLSGVFLLVLWAVRAGAFVRFISKPVLVGFLAGLGIEILTSQVEKMLNVSVDTGKWFTDVVKIVEKLPDASLASVAVGVSTIAIVRLCRRFVPRVPGPLVALVVVGGVVALTDPGGVTLLGDIPSQLPGLSLPSVPLGAWLDLTATAMAIATLTVTEGLLVAGASARRHGDEFDSNAEMFPFGAANLAATITSGMPIGASASRTAAMESTGSRSQLPAVVAGVSVAVVVLLFSDVVAAIPSAALAGLVANAVVSIIDVRAMRFFARVRRSELVIAVGCAAGVLALGPIGGLALATLATAVDLVRRVATAPWATLGTPARSDWETARFARGPRSEVPPARGEPIEVIRIAGPLFFANADVLRERVVALADQPAIAWVVLDCEAVTDIDPTASEALSEVLEHVHNRRKVLALSRVTQAVRDLLALYGLLDAVTPARIYESTRAAMAAYEAELGTDDQSNEGE